MSTLKHQDIETLVEECNSCSETTLSVYIEDSLCYRCQTTDADD